VTKMKRRTSWIKWLLLGWVTAVISVYYIAHKPFELPHVIGLFQSVRALSAAGVVVALATGVGFILLRDTSMAPMDRLVWASGLGLGALALVALGLGCASLLRPWLLWLLTIGGLAAVLRPLWRGLVQAWVDSDWRPKDRFQGVLASYCALVLLMGLVRSLAPPTAWDGLVYHLAGPKLYLSGGLVSHPIDLPYLGFPQLVEMLFTWGMGIGGERAASPIHWWYGLLTTLALVTAGRRHGGHSNGWLAAATLLSGRTAARLLGWPYVDLALLLYGTLGFLAIERLGDQADRVWVVLTGVSAGLALSTKYTAAALLPALMASAAIIRLPAVSNDESGAAALVRDCLLLSGIAGFVWLPWLIKNLLSTRNPVYPFFLGGMHWDAWRRWWFDRPGTGLARTAPWKLLTVPWDATVWGVEGAAGYSATIGPLYLALTPLLLVTWRRLNPKHQVRVQTALAFSAVLYVFWLWGVARTALLQQTRLLLPAFGPLALVAAQAAEGMRLGRSQHIDWHWIVRGVIALVLVLTLVSCLLAFVQARPLPVLLGIETQGNYLTRRLGWHYWAMTHLNTELNPEAVVLFLWEPRSYYCSLDCRPDALLDRWLHATYLHGHNPVDIADAWRDLGVTHVLLYRDGLNHILGAGFDPVTPEDVAALEALLEEEAALVKSLGSAYELYLLEDTP